MNNSFLKFREVESSEYPILEKAKSMEDKVMDLSELDKPLFEFEVNEKEVYQEKKDLDSEFIKKLYEVDDLEINERENLEEKLEKLINEYFDDLKSKSECPETIPDRPFEVTDLEKLTPEETEEMRKEFDSKKSKLKEQWEKENERPWPKYEKDVYSSNRKLIRKAGSDYDAHHIQPISMGGKNEVSNITPLNAEVHYDRQGVHSPDSPYNKIETTLGGM